MMSRIRWVGSLEMAVTEPVAEAGTKAALATMVPSPALSVETTGCVPDPHRVRKLMEAGGTTVALRG